MVPKTQRRGCGSSLISCMPSFELKITFYSTIIDRSVCSKLESRVILCGSLMACEDGCCKSVKTLDMFSWLTFHAGQYDSKPWIWDLAHNLLFGNSCHACSPNCNSNYLSNIIIRLQQNWRHLGVLTSSLRSLLTIFHTRADHLTCYPSCWAFENCAATG